MLNTLKQWFVGKLTPILIITVILMSIALNLLVIKVNNLNKENGSLSSQLQIANDSYDKCKDNHLLNNSVIDSNINFKKLISKGTNEELSKMQDRFNKINNAACINGNKSNIRLIENKQNENSTDNYDDLTSEQLSNLNSELVIKSLYKRQSEIKGVIK